MDECMILLAALNFSTAHGAEPPDLSGAWRLDYSVVTRNRVPVLGRIKSASMGWALAQVRYTDGRWVQEHEVCGGTVRAGLVRSELPLAYLHHVPQKTYTIVIGAETDSLAFYADTGTFMSGHDPACDSLPQSPDDPCARDWDEDGHPGATVRVKPPLFRWVDVYVAQKTHMVLHGEVKTDDHIEGYTQMQVMKTSVLGASNNLFAQTPAAVFVAEESRFTMTRVADTATCAELTPPPK